MIVRTGKTAMLPALVLCCLFLFSGIAGTQPGEGAFASLSRPGAGALDPRDIRYLGALRLPPDGEGDENAFAYGGEAMAFCQSGDSGKGSLYLTGHNWFTRVAEIGIPGPSPLRDPEALPQASLLQPFSDIRGPLFSRWTLEIPRVGLEALDGKLFFCWGAHFEEASGWGTHGARSLDLSLPPPEAVCSVGGRQWVYATNDYLFGIPPAWAAAHLPGYDLASGRFRDGGWGGMGPALFALRSRDILEAGMDEAVRAVPLILYDNSYTGDEGAKVTGYSHADSFSGGAWVDTSAGSAVVFIGTHGYGKTWYGFANGVRYPLGGNEEEVYPAVPPPPYEQRGWWNSDFRPVMTLYDPLDLARAAKGTLPASQVQPYALLDLSGYMLRGKLDTDMQLLGDAAYDRARALLYVQELLADGDRPVIHVFRIGE